MISIVDRVKYRYRDIFLQRYSISIYFHYLTMSMGFMSSRVTAESTSNHCNLWPYGPTLFNRLRRRLPLINVDIPTSLLNYLDGVNLGEKITRSTLFLLNLLTWTSIDNFIIAGMPPCTLHALNAANL